MEHALLDSAACSRLLRGTGLTPVQIRSAMARARPGWSTPSTSSISAWMRPEGHTRAPTLPRDDLRAWLAESIGMPLDTLLRACAGVLSPEPNDRARLLALAANETPVELAYHPDADPGNGAGWSLLVGDRTVAVGTLDKVLNAS